MADTAWTQADLDALEKSIALGARKVKYSDKEVEYASIREMLMTRDIIRRALGKTSAGGAVFYIPTSKGL